MIVSSSLVDTLSGVIENFVFSHISIDKVLPPEHGYETSWIL